MSKVNETIVETVLENRTPKKNIARDVGKRVVENVTPEQLVTTLEKWESERISGYTTGLPPISFRFVSDKNDFVMVGVDTFKEKSTVVYVTDDGFGNDKTIPSQVVTAYETALSNKKKAELDEAKRLKEHKKKMDKVYNQESNKNG
jgi:hypothetical protein